MMLYVRRGIHDKTFLFFFSLFSIFSSIKNPLHFFLKYNINFNKNQYYFFDKN